MEHSLEEFKPPPNIPRSPQELGDKILFYGNFMDGLEFVSSHLTTNTIGSKTLVIRGRAGSGKKSLIKKVQEMYLKNASTIHVSPFHYPDDYSAIKGIAQQVGLEVSSSIDEIVTAIGNCKKRLVIVLHNFETFCRKNQSLLYLLTDLTQDDKNISLIGLTMDFNCAANLEKRVRSRLNPVFYELCTPYSNVDEYIYFASDLLGGYEFKETTKETLTLMFSHKRSIRPLKRYLVSICEWDEEGNMSVQEGIPVMDQKNNMRFFGGQSDIRLLGERLAWLTKPQLELLKVAVCYSSQDESNFEFNIQSLEHFARNRGIKNFDTSSDVFFKNIKTLSKISLIKALKPDLPLNVFSKFTLGITPAQFRHVLELNRNFHNVRTDDLWRSLH